VVIVYLVSPVILGLMVIKRLNWNWIKFSRSL